MWMSGYGSRDKPAEGKLHDLWAKALAIEDTDGRRCLLISLDLVGVPRDLSLKVCETIGKQHRSVAKPIVLQLARTLLLVFSQPVSSCKIAQ